MTNSKTYCSAFWNHANIRSGDRIFPCCRFKTPVDKFNGDLTSILKSKSFNDLRSKSLNGELIDGCKKCYYEESIGKESLREKINKEYTNDKVELKFLEIGFDNICNLTCDGCNVEFSHSWGINSFPTKHIKELIQTVTDIYNIPNTIDKILFLGGEPLMTNKHYKFLLDCSNIENITVIYNTNGTFLFKQEHIELLNKCKKVEIILSIDGYGNLNEIVRKNSRWNQILEFIEQIKNTSFHLTIHSVIHINNWHGLAELSNFIDNISLPWTVNIVTYPPHLDIKNLSNTDKLKLKTTIKTINKPELNYLLEHIKICD